MDHELVAIRRGARTGLPVIIAVHSSALGQAVGGCRIWRYPNWRDGLTDALRLSAGMTLKTALAGVANGGAKAVVAIPEGAPEPDRRALLHDVGDAIEALGGAYATGPDVGTGPADMDVIAERTPHVFCRTGGSGDSSPHTADGIMAALRATCAHLYDTPSLAGRAFTVIGLGHVGAPVARALAAEGAALSVTDIDETRAKLAADLGATWLDPAAAATAETDVLVPAALGGLLTADLVPRLSCRAVVGPANNQLATDDVADHLAARGILWAPDYVVSAGGVIYALSRELHGRTDDEANALVAGIANTLTSIFDAATRDAVTPHTAARTLATTRLSST